MRRPLTVNVDEHILDALRAAAARDGVPEEELVDEALRRWFGLRGVAVLDDIADRREASEPRTAIDDEKAMTIALREVRAARRGRRARGAQQRGCVRAVLDLNVYVSAAINPSGGSPGLLEELGQVLHRPNLRRYFTTVEADELLTAIEGVADEATDTDPSAIEALNRDPDDDYLIALARHGRADWLVTGDPDLLDVENAPTPIVSPRAFLRELGRT